MQYTFQDFEAERDKGPKQLAQFLDSAIQAHKSSAEYKTAVTADAYDRQRNTTINAYIEYLYNLSGDKVRDFTSSNNRIPSNFFNRLNTQRVMYSLGNGVSFTQPNESGEDETKARLGKHFDHDIKELMYYASIHAVAFGFWNLDRLYIFKVTEFVPFWDEHTGALRAGVRFWQLDKNKPLSVVLYEEDGYTEFQDSEKTNGLQVVNEKRAYKTTYSYVPADDEFLIVGEENYGSLPIVPAWASRLKQSTLVGMQASIDAYDLIRSGFANDLTDCAQIYWIVKNAGGMDDSELNQFRDRLKLMHIANIDTDAGSGVEPYTQDIPYQARETFLNEIRNGIYEDFGALDVHTVAAGATNDHVYAAYQPMDENADDFEFWCAEAICQILALLGIDDYPVFKRNRISNQKEQVEMVVQEAQWLDTATVLKKLPNIQADEIQAILDALDGEDMTRFGIGEEETWQTPSQEEQHQISASR